MSNFTDDLTHTRGTGATRINAAGLIVGVDFSATSNTIGTGAKTFTLTADANVDRDWPVGSAVRVVDQVSANTMEGTVTTYTPSTQALVLDITSVTGSGTFTNWRIGSLEVRRDADGVLREPLRSNSISRSFEFDNAFWEKKLATLTPGVVSPDGSANAFKIVKNNGELTGHILRRANVGSGTGTPRTAAIHARFAGVRYLAISVLVTFDNASNRNRCVIYDLLTGLKVFQDNTFDHFGPDALERLPNSWWRIQATSRRDQAGWDSFELAFSTDGTSAGITNYIGDGVNGVEIYGADYQLSSTTGTQDYITSHIPTNGVAVTRNADTFTFTSSAIAKFRQGQGALIVEANASDSGTAQRAALRLTGPSGEIRLGKQGITGSGNFTKMAEGGNVQLLGNANQGVTNNGLEYSLLNPTDTRTSVALTPVPALNAIAYDGTSGFGAITYGNIENTYNANASSIDFKGVGLTTLNGCHWNGSRFLLTVGAANSVFLSTDGISYRRVNTPVITQACNEVTSGMVGPTLRNVIVGNAGFIATSDDNGETWTARTSGVTDRIDAVTRSASLFVATTNRSVNSNGLRSTDGISWTVFTIDATPKADVHFANGLFVAVGSSGSIVTSPDGTTWTASPSSGVVTTQQLNGVHYNASAALWVAVGNAGTIITATDPTGTWTLQTSGTIGSLNEVTYFNNLWVVNNAGGGVLTSPNATAWTARSTNIAGAGVGIAASATRLIITGTSGQFGSSEDGLTYTSRTNNNNATLNGIAYGAGVYVSVGGNINGSGYIATIDGAGTVTRRESGIAQGINNVKFGLGKFFAVTNGNTTQVRSSTNGVTWSGVTAGGNSVFNLGISEEQNRIIVMRSGNTNPLLVSSDGGLTFNDSSLGTPLNVSTGDVTFANGVWVVVFPQGRIFTSPTGLTSTWTERTSGTTQNLTSVMFSIRDQRWYAAGNAGTLLYSDDNGVTWASVNNAGFGAVSNTTLQASKLLQQWKSGRNTMALSYKANEVIVGLNGVAVSDTSNTIPSITAGVLGESFNGKIKSVKFQPNPLTLAEVKATTGVTA